MKEETIESKLIFEGKFVRLRIDKIKLNNGSIIEREIVERMSGVSILPVNYKNEFLLIESYRHAINQTCLELPGGAVSSIDNNTREAAQRELFEETGFKAINLDLLFETKGSGIVIHNVSYYLATKLYTPLEKRFVDEQENIKVIPTSVDKALKMARNAEFRNPAFSLMVIMAAEKLYGF